jgi:hypothetical protein
LDGMRAPPFSIQAWTDPLAAVLSSRGLASAISPDRQALSKV